MSKMQDPVSGFIYPEAWIARCASPESFPLIEHGLAVLTADGSVRRRGYTTGSTAAAAAKAAILSLQGTPITEVSIITPVGIRIHIPVQAQEGRGECRKYAGDYPADVTAGMLFIAQARPTKSGVSLTFGDGIGRWNRTTPRYHIGDPAVSPQARDVIQTAIEEALQKIGLGGVEICIIAQHGREIAQKTLNHKVGVINGISILGTTGFVEPWDDHLEQAAMDRAKHAERVVLTTGRVGLRYARMLFPDHEVILAGSRLDHIIPHLSGDVIICGLPALVLKYLNPSILEGTGYTTIEAFMSSERFLDAVQHSFAIYKQTHPAIRIVIVNREGEIIGDSG